MVRTSDKFVVMRDSFFLGMAHDKKTKASAWLWSSVLEDAYRFPCREDADMKARVYCDTAVYSIWSIPERLQDTMKK